jgi:hypothetical protein
MLIHLNENASDRRILDVTSLAGTVASFVSNGNVGIGTTNPDNKLAVWGTNNGLDSSQGTINVYTTDTAAINTGGSIGLGGYYTGTSQAIPFANITGKKENSSSSDAAGYLAFLTRNSSTGTGERMRITSGGNVLIGTTNNSGEKLRVDGTIGVYGATIASGYSRAFYVRGAQNVADDGTLTLSVTNTSLVFIAENNTGTGALFFCGYASATITKISDPSNMFDTADTAGKLCIFKNAVTDVTTIKNRLGGSRNITVSYIGVSD